MKKIFPGAVAATTGLVALAFLGCGKATTDPLVPEVTTVRNELLTTNGGSLYAEDCFQAQVPLPTPWGKSTIGLPGSGKPWTDNNNFLHLAEVEVYGDP